MLEAQAAGGGGVGELEGVRRVGGFCWDEAAFHCLQVTRLH